MPNTKSAKKRLRQNLERRDRNRSVKSGLRTQLKKVRTAVAAGQVDEAQTEFRAAQKALDQAGAKNTIHKNKASRLKSRLAARVKNAQKAAK